MHAAITARRAGGASLAAVSDRRAPGSVRGSAGGSPGRPPAPRNAQDEDVSALLRLIQPLGKDGALLPRKRAQLRRCIGDFYVIARGRDIICCAALHVHADRQLGEIACVATRESHRGQGYGGLLLRHIEQRARAAGLRRLFLRSAHAVGWFLRHGFTEEGPSPLLQHGGRSLPERNSQMLSKRLF